jgi:xanthine dehydrogenase accessory factor
MTDILQLAADLHKRHRPFVLATVVWARGPSSGKQGAKAIIEMDGAIHGWIGGACAEPTVLREARKVLNDGDARLMYLGPAEELDGVSRKGVLSVPISCSSEGALEVFMEPVLPEPHVVVIGSSPSVGNLLRLLDAMDWRATLVNEGDPMEVPASVAVLDSVARLPEVGVDEATSIVVATQGHYDEPALEAALATPASYIGLVASSRRAATVLGYLADRGVGEAQIGRVDAPAGLDLGRIEHREIAVAVLARLVQLRAAGSIGGASKAVPIPTTAIDPVCDMEVEMATAKFTSDLDGQTFYFCCPACKGMFEKAPAEYVG